MAELSRTSATTVATIKYYLREGLLHSGLRTSATQSQYDDSHVRRIGLIRALLDTGRLSVARTAEVLAAMDDPDVSLNHLLMTTQRSLPAAAASHQDLDLALAQVDDLVVSHGWTVSTDNPGRQVAADVLATLAALGRDDRALIEAWASAAQVAAEADLNAVAQGPDRSRIIETVVVGTILGDVMIAALRRLAQESMSRKQYPPESSPGGGCDHVSS